MEVGAAPGLFETPQLRHVREKNKITVCQGEIWEAPQPDLGGVAKRSSGDRSPSAHAFSQEYLNDLDSEMFDRVRKLENTCRRHMTDLEEAGRRRLECTRKVQQRLSVSWRAARDLQREKDARPTMTSPGRDG